MPVSPPVCVVTGAAAGIGRAIARRFVQAEWAVVGVDVDERAMAATADELGAAGAFHPVLADVADRDVLATAAADAEGLGALRCWVNNAAINFMGSADDMDPDVLDRGVAVNLGGVFWGTHAAVACMLRNGGGSIVNISSVQSLMGIKGFAGYAACKGAVNSLTRQVAAEYAGRGIRCNAVSPGVIVTEMHHKLLAEHPDPEAVRSFHRALCPIGRMGTSEDVAEAVYFLARDETAGFITGQLIQVDGGATIVAPGQV